MKNKQTGTVKAALLWTLVILNSIGLACVVYNKYHTQNTIHNLVGTWVGHNVTVSEEKGYREWDKTVEITEQKDSRFRGTMTYPDGTKHFYGVIYPDNISFTWVSQPAKGYVQGRILSDNKIGACYLESYEEGTAGCATLVRE